MCGKSSFPGRHVRHAWIQALNLLPELCEVLRQGFALQFVVPCLGYWGPSYFFYGNQVLDAHQAIQ